jgi:hypothetical protein
MKVALLVAIFLALAGSSFATTKPLYSYPGTLAYMNILADEFQRSVDSTGKLNPAFSKKLFASYMRSFLMNSHAGKPVPSDSKVMVHFDAPVDIRNFKFGILEVRSTQSPSIPVGFGKELAVKVISNDRDPSIIWLAPENGNFGQGRQYLFYFTDAASRFYHANFRIAD